MCVRHDALNDDFREKPLTLCTAFNIFELFCQNRWKTMEDQNKSFSICIFQIVHTV